MTTKKYRKLPVVIEAMQFTDESKDRVFNWVRYNCYAVRGIDNNLVMFIQTLEGDMRVNIGDYVIKGVRGEFYPCEKTIFEETYEEVVDE